MTGPEILQVCKGAGCRKRITYRNMCPFGWDFYHGGQKKGDRLMLDWDEYHYDADKIYRAVQEWLQSLHP